MPKKLGEVLQLTVEFQLLLFQQKKKIRPIRRLSQVTEVQKLGQF